MKTMQGLLENVVHRMLNTRESDSETYLLEYLRNKTLIDVLKDHPHFETVKTSCNGEEMYGALVYETCDYDKIITYIPFTKGCSEQFDPDVLVAGLNKRELRHLDNLRNIRIDDEGLTETDSCVQLSYQQNAFPSRDFLLLGVDSTSSMVRDTFLLRFTDEGWVDYDYIILNYEDNDITEFIHNGTTHVFDVDESFNIKDRLYDEGIDAWLHKIFDGIKTDRDIYNVNVLGNWNLGELCQNINMISMMVNDYICDFKPCNILKDPPNSTMTQERGNYAGFKEEPQQKGRTKNKSNFCDNVKKLEEEEVDYDYIEELVIPNRDRDGKKYKLIIYIQ